MTNNDFTLTMIDTAENNTYKYLFKLVGTINDEISQPSVDIVFPETDYENAQYARFAGQTRKISFTADLQVRTDDTADGTATGLGFDGNTVKTIQDQRDWLANYIFNPDSDARFILQHDFWFPDAIDVVFKKLLMTISDKATLHSTMMFEFAIGKNFIGV